MRTNEDPQSSDNGDDLVDADATALAELDARLSVVRDRVKGVALGFNTGFYLCGRAGTSKTYTVTDTLQRAARPFQYHRGHLTPLGLFDLLSDYPNGLIFLDDVSHLLKSDVAQQLLLAALGKNAEAHGPRVVRYRRQGGDHEVKFSGGIVIVSNLPISTGPLLDAFKSRLNYLVFDPTEEQMTALMRHLASKGWRSGSQVIGPDDCLEVCEHVIAESIRLNVSLDIRVLVDKALPDFAQYRDGHAETHWRDLVTSTMECRLTELRHSAEARQPAMTQLRQKMSDQALVAALVEQFPALEDQKTEWARLTGKSVRTLFRHKAELQGMTE
ncbi:MAG: hypothetical protein NT062_10765 [Proteobacteria bacterium]|nr:hypothetical protein [Pseudomonadota bacterium]